MGFALLFPANVSSMMFISTRAHLVVTLLYLAAMLSTLWLLSTERFKPFAAAAILASGALAIFAKESGATVIVAIALLLIYERKTRNRRLGRVYVVLLFAGLCAAFALYLGLRSRSGAVTAAHICLFQQPAIARRRHLGNLHEVFWFRACRGGSLSRRECQRDDKDDDRHGYQAVRRCRCRLCGDDGAAPSGCH